jgi:hypothetical protein
VKYPRRTILITAILIVFAPICPVDGADPVRLSVTNQNIFPAGSGSEKELFQDEGLDVEIIRMNTPNTVTALLTGDVGYTLLLGFVVTSSSYFYGYPRQKAEHGEEGSITPCQKTIEAVGHASAARRSGFS